MCSSFTWGTVSRKQSNYKGLRCKAGTHLTDLLMPPFVIPQVMGDTSAMHCTPHAPIKCRGSHQS